jgi:hypothetical protein
MFGYTVCIGTHFEPGFLGEGTRVIVHKYPDPSEVIKYKCKFLSDITLAGCTPGSVGCSEPWANVVDHMIQDRVSICRVLYSLCTALFGVYKMTMGEVKSVH